jgi:hypothetical protein
MTTEGAIALIWILALLIALGLTVGAVSMIVRVINAAREIDRLLKQTLPSAVGIVNNTAAITELQVIVNAASPLLEGAASIKRSTEGIRAKVDRLGAMFAHGAQP